tara:strand:- start:2097 stop:2627 length:531 start_codon:yes stop_codon:yes gene_type:complete
MATSLNQTYRNITIRQMMTTLHEIQFNHKNIHSFYTRSLEEVDIVKMDLNLFPLMHATPVGAIVDEQTITYSIDVLIADQVNEDIEVAELSQTRRPLIDAYSQTLLTLKDVIANFRQNIQTGSYVDARIDIEMPLSCTPFTARFANSLTGWGTTFNITCQNTNNLCDVPQTMNDGQ